MLRSRDTFSEGASLDFYLQAASSPSIPAKRHIHSCACPRPPSSITLSTSPSQGLLFLYTLRSPVVDLAWTPPQGKHRPNASSACCSLPPTTTVSYGTYLTRFCCRRSATQPLRCSTWPVSASFACVQQSRKRGFLLLVIECVKSSRPVARLANSGL